MAVVKNKIKVLFFVDRMLRGGIQSFVLDNMTHLNKDIIQIDYLVLDDGANYELEDTIGSLGSKVYKLKGIWLRRPTDYYAYCNSLNNFFANHRDYKIVHMHSSSKNCMVLYYARNCLTLLNKIGIENNKYYVFLYIILSIMLVLPRTFVSIILQVSNRMKEYSVLLIIERIFYASLLAIMLVCDVRSFKILLLSDLTGKVISLIYGLGCCSNMIFIRPEFTKKTFLEIKDNICAGIFLVLWNISSLLITGIVQFFIENRWNMETFSKVSLTFNISRMLMVIINSVSVVMFPLIKNVKQEEFPNLYIQIRKAAMIILMAILIFYYPMRIILTIWLPQYADSFKYVALLLPMCIFESKSEMLVSTFLKAMRKETILFKCNLIIIFISLSFSYIIVYMMSSLVLAVLSITIFLMVKSILLEYFVSKVIPIKVKKDIVIESIIVLVFIACSWFINSLVSCLMYLLVYTIYLHNNRFYLSNIKLVSKVPRTDNSGVF